jgi:DNA-binding NarL/FixJ family response regulator
MTTERTTPSALTFAKLLGDGPMARVALEASLAKLDAPAFIVSEKGTILHSNAIGTENAAKSEDALRTKLVRAIRSLGDETCAGAALVTPLRCDAKPTYYLVIFRGRTSAVDDVESAATLWGLTKRQKETLAFLAEGFSNKTIAVRLGCAERTVECHLTSIFQKSGFQGRSALLAAMARTKR